MADEAPFTPVSEAEDETAIDTTADDIMADSVHDEVIADTQEVDIDGGLPEDGATPLPAEDGLENLEEHHDEAGGEGHESEYRDGEIPADETQPVEGEEHEEIMDPLDEPASGWGEEETAPEDEAEAPFSQHSRPPTGGSNRPPGDEEAVDDITKEVPAEEEKMESPVPHIGEKLSRGGTPHDSPHGSQTRLHRMGPLTPPEAISPREHSRLDEPIDGDDLDEELASPEQDRDALIEMYHAAIATREKLQTENHQLQHKLAEFFKKKKSEEQRGGDMEKNEADQEQRYLKYMSQLEELRAEDSVMREKDATEIEELQRKCDEKRNEVEAHRQKFAEFKRQVALNAINSRSGKPIPDRDVEAYLTAENRKDQEVIQVRLENIKLKNKLKKKEQQLKSKEELADGLHLIDFEQLKIENQTYNEKIEERNEELLKLRKKITNTVQVLTHLKEKLQFVQGENSLFKAQLREVEAQVAQKRDILTRTKQARDALRIDNHRLRQNCGLLGNEPLLRDFEERKDEADALREKLEKLKMQHAELTLNTTSIRRKIEQMKTSE